MKATTVVFMFRTLLKTSTLLLPHGDIFFFIPWRFTSATACYRLLLDVIPLILLEKGKQKSTPLRINPPQIQYINIYRKWIISTGNTNSEPT